MGALKKLEIIIQTVYNAHLILKFHDIKRYFNKLKKIHSVILKCCLKYIFFVTKNIQRHRKNVNTIKNN